MTHFRHVDQRPSLYPVFYLPDTAVLFHREFITILSH